MKKGILVLALIFLSGCTTIHIPNYIPDKNPYKKRFDSSYADVYAATISELEDEGWVIVSQADPAIYEHRRKAYKEDSKQILLFTQIRETSFFFGSRYARMNVFLKAEESKMTDIEIRYVTVTSIPLKTFYGYKDDRFIRQLLEGIQSRLE